ncbi:MAG TPA: DUF4097 family beta strand repeat-containing protein [Bryobacteraceae bacterium]|nr:DUF4097 family beta strand repeat-containing protein [Bryobacteraceae bacterium]
MKRFGLAVAMALPALMTAQERIAVPLTDPARPATVRVELVNGSVSVKAYNGKEVIVEAKTQDEETRRGKQRESAPEGLKRIPIGGNSLEISEENNEVRIESGAPMRSVDLEVQVPMRSTLKLEVVNGGDIKVEGVTGDIEAENVNGNVILTNISGSAVAHALNGRLVAVFTQVAPQKAMSFSSLNGNIDVTLPPSVKANVKVKTDNGDLYSDFDIALKAGGQPATEAGRDGKGKYKVKIDRTVYGAINGGGPEFQFSNFNGNIYIRKAGSVANPR